jgi:hypothetical protein
MLVRAVKIRKMSVILAGSLPEMSEKITTNPVTIPTRLMAT